MTKPRPTDDAFNRLAAAEDRFLRSEFLAPALRGGEVQVRIAGVICRLAIEPRDFQGWGVFKPASHSQAKLVRAATLSERQRTLSIPLVSSSSPVGCRNNGWQRRHRADTRFRSMAWCGPAGRRRSALRSDRDALRWRAVLVRRFRCPLGPGHGRSPAQALDKLTPLEAVSRPGLTAEERAAYAVNYALRHTRHRRKHARIAREERLRQAWPTPAPSLGDMSSGRTCTHRDLRGGWSPARLGDRQERPRRPGGRHLPEWRG